MSEFEQMKGFRPQLKSLSKAYHLSLQTSTRSFSRCITRLAPRGRGNLTSPSCPSPCKGEGRLQSRQGEVILCSP